MWQDQHFVHLPAGRAVVEEADGVIYLAAALRNDGNGVAVLHGWYPSVDWQLAPQTHAPVEQFRRLTRDSTSQPVTSGSGRAPSGTPAIPTPAVPRRDRSARPTHRRHPLRRPRRRPACHRSLRPHTGRRRLSAHIVALPEPRSARSALRSRRGHRRQLPPMPGSSAHPTKYRRNGRRSDAPDARLRPHGAANIGWRHAAGYDAVGRSATQTVSQPRWPPRPPVVAPGTALVQERTAANASRAESASARPGADGLFVEGV